MDSRRILKQGAQLSFPGMDCTIDALVGRGSNAIVYLGSYPDAQLNHLRHRVLIKELFPYDPQGQIFRNEKGDICHAEETEEAWRLHGLSFQRGNEIHLRLSGEHPDTVDANINTFRLHQTLYSVLGYSGGRSMDKELAQQREIPLTVHIRRLLGALNALEAFHASGYLHLDISPDNILLIGDGKKERVTLIDFNSVHTLQEISRGDCVYYSAKEGYTAPEVRSGRLSRIGFSTDLYSMTAVFYRCLTGEGLTILQTVRGLVPDISGAPCLKEAPETVRSMVRKILKRGLAALPARRYGTVDQMRQDLEELQERIEGKGITHAALWETGRANVLRAVNENPAFAYIKEEEGLYPIIGENERGEAIPFETLIRKMTGPDGGSVFLLGAGGAGKTTALLRTAYLQESKYSGMESAVTYISLYGWTEDKKSYIKDKILENLKFKPETDSMETARHELVRLLSDPMHTKLGERPKLLLLLDGLNEASGNTGALIREILELSAMPGIRILLAGRSESGELPFEKLYLRPLEEGEVKRALAGNGILPPEKEEMFQLLRSPMMLSIYLKAALDQEKQLFIDTQEELLDRYFAAILDKEIRELPQDEAQRWQTEAALYYVLPEMARLMAAKGGTVTDQDMLPTAEKCYRRLSKRFMRKVFPQWIGHMADIRGDTQNAEEWYGLLVHGILWRRLGLIVRDGQGAYRTAHQLIEEYLVTRQSSFGRRFARHERILAALAAAAGIVVLLGCYELVYIPYSASRTGEAKEPYEQAFAENVLDAAFSSYVECAGQYGAISELLACLREETVDEDTYERALNLCRSELSTAGLMGTGQAVGYLEMLYSSGEVMPWSGQALSKEAYQELIALPGQRAEAYSRYLNVLEQARADISLWEYFGEDYGKRLEGLLQADAYVLGSYYNQIIAPELNAMEQGGEEQQQNYRLYMKSIALVAKQQEITAKASENIEIYLEQQAEALRQFRQSGLLKLSETTEE